MCGDLEDESRFDDEVFAWLIANARAHGAAPQADSEWTVNAGTSAEMDAAFRGALSRVLAGIAAAPEGSRGDAIGGQAIVLARLAGFLAGHLPPETDLFRTLVDAMLDGHHEAERRLKTLHEHHRDAHDHHHEATHGPGHEH